jgi:hypothetical protein
VHNGCGHTVDLTKRVMISGEGELEDATIDFRGNSPVFRLQRCAYLHNIFIDMSGKLFGTLVAIRECWLMSPRDCLSRSISWYICSAVLFFTSDTLYFIVHQTYFLLGW